MQGAKSSNVQNYARCKIMQGAKLCKVQNYAMGKIMQGETFCKVKIMQSARLYNAKLCQVLSPCSVTA